MSALKTLKLTSPQVLLPEIETFLSTQPTEVNNFVAFCLKELLTTPHLNSSFWVCTSASKLYALVKVMRYLLNANVQVDTIDADMQLYNTRFNWETGVLLGRIQG